MDKVVHFEIPAEDLERAQKFYKNVFKWDLNHIKDMNYTIVHTVKTSEKGMPIESGAINGGMMKRKEPIKNPVITINVADIDASMKLLKKEGGKTVLEKFKVGDMGYCSYFRDTEGNILGLWQNLK